MVSQTPELGWTPQKAGKPPGPAWRSLAGLCGLHGQRTRHEGGCARLEAKGMATSGVSLNIQPARLAGVGV